MSEATAIAAGANGHSLYSNFDHIHPPIGPDGTPNAFYEALRDESVEANRPIGWSEAYNGFWVITGYPEVLDAMHNTTAFSNDAVTFPSYGVNEPLMLAGQDDPAHKRARLLVNEPFSPGKVVDFTRLLRDNVNSLIDGIIQSGSADVAKIIGNPVPAILTAVIMGLPAELGPRFFSWTWALSHGSFTDPEAAGVKIKEMYAYFEKVIEDRRANPGEDVLSRVVQAKIDGDYLNQTELLGFCTTLLLGGIDNTSKLIATALWRLAWDLELRHRLTRDPRVIPTAIDEFLRYYAPASVGRLIKEDVTIADVPMKAGQYAMLMAPIANRDPRVFPYPDTLIADRSPNKHLGLGTGIHRCLGAHVLRVESKIVLEEFLKRIPEFELDRSQPSEWAAGQVAGMGTVPIVFEPGEPLSSEPLNEGVRTWLDHAAGKEAFN
ncbi:MAG TPA: cytochrome P450 [Candidatus Binataceae bacterium]|nr:cytochrome P450 [Candidatus Binataceae bacterium]